MTASIEKFAYVHGDKFSDGSIEFVFQSTIGTNLSDLEDIFLHNKTVIADGKIWEVLQHRSTVNHIADNSIYGDRMPRYHDTT